MKPVRPNLQRSDNFITVASINVDSISVLKFLMGLVTRKPEMFNRQISISGYDETCSGGTVNVVASRLC